MISTKQVARRAGVLYLLFSIFGIFALLYVPSVLIVHGDPAATARNIAASETLYRAGIVADLLAQAGFIWVTVVLYQLLRGVDSILALLMLVLSVVQMPIVFVSETSHLALLPLVHNAGPWTALSEAQRNAQISLSLSGYQNGLLVTELFMGLWLFPFGLLIAKSRFLPRFLGVLLFLAGLAYVSETVTWLLFPAYGPAVGKVASPLRALELVIPLWLLIVGAKDRPLEPLSAGVARTA
jgi:hypothetical protein